MDNQDNKQVQLQANIDDEVAEGIYVNFANILHNNNEFVLDFGRIVPGKQDFNILSRLILNPSNAKRLKETLEDNIQQYEEKHGDITIEEASSDKKVGF